MMQNKNWIQLIGILVCMNLFYGCSGLQKEFINKNYFDLKIPAANFALGNVQQGSSLLVKEFLINSSFDSHSLVYQIKKNEYVSDYYNEFVSYPAKLITEKITEYLYTSAYFKPALTQMREDIDFRLSGKITKLYGDFKGKNHPQAIMELRIILEKRTDNSFNAIYGNTYLAREPIPSQTPAHLIIGWNKGLEKSMNRFIRDLKIIDP